MILITWYNFSRGNFSFLPAAVTLCKIKSRTTRAEASSVVELLPAVISTSLSSQLELAGWTGVIHFCNPSTGVAL